MTGPAILRVPATAEALRGFYAWLEDAATSTGVPRQILSRMHVAAEEAVSNAVRHSGGPEITIILNMTQSAAALIIEDNGAAFDPTTAPLPEPGRDLAEIVPGGWGIGLMRRFCPDVRYDRIGNINQLTLNYPIK